MISILRRILRSADSQCREHLDSLIDDKIPHLPRKVPFSFGVEPYSHRDQRDARQLPHVRFQALEQHESNFTWLNSCAESFGLLIWSKVEPVALPITEITCVRASKSHGHGPIIEAGVKAEGMSDFKCYLHQTH